MLGGQVIIEPGQTDREIESWFRILDRNGMRVCRIRMFEEYMHDTSSDTWDFSLFDKAFAAAEKYNIRIFATLFPLDKNNAVSLGGFKLPSDEAHLARIENYIARTVGHFSRFSSLYGCALYSGASEQRRSGLCQALCAEQPGNVAPLGECDAERQGIA